MRVLFMGTPDFAVDTLQTLIQSEHEVIGVVTQPDKPKGRSGKMQYSPVKEVAVEHGITVYQPEKVRDEAFVQKMRELRPDAAVVAAFGQILPKELLEVPKYGCFNVHASLLPKLRGAAPIQWAVINGDSVSGVTIMQMAEGLDTGDMLLTEVCRLAPKETGGSLFERLAKLGGPMILKVLQAAEAGTLHPVAQDEEAHTYAGMLSKETGRLDFSKPAEVLERLIRGLNPWPSAYCFLNGKMLKIWEADVVSVAQEGETDIESGTVTEILKDAFLVRTGRDYLRVTQVQLEGKKRMDAAAFLRGHSLEKGVVLQSTR